MAEEQRDMIDDLIDIQENWQSFSNPLGDLADGLIDPTKAHVFNPADYKERPRANSINCLRNTAKRQDACTRCVDVCPTDAITFDGKRVVVGDTCRECGLCAVMCPTEVFLIRSCQPSTLYDRIARIAGAYKQCYITCTRALGRYPRDNEIVLPCVGAMSAELWFALLADYDNISVYLPLGICDRCRTTTGEEIYAEAISQAEEWSEESVGLEVDEAELDHDQTRAYRRAQFVNSMARAGQQLLVGTNPALMGARAIANRIKAHSTRLNEMQRNMEQIMGGKTTLNRRHVLTKKRRLVLGALQDWPELANHFELPVPVCDLSLCTMCGDCVNACAIHACELDEAGQFIVRNAWCVNCGTCAAVCEDGALSMVPCDPAELVIPDPNAAKAAEQRERIAKAREEGKEKLKRTLGVIGNMLEES